jgi:hypothetical protein
MAAAAMTRCASSRTYHRTALPGTRLLDGAIQPRRRHPPGVETVAPGDVAKGQDPVARPIQTGVNNMDQPGLNRAQDRARAQKLREGSRAINRPGRSGYADGQENP